MAQLSYAFVDSAPTSSTTQPRHPEVSPFVLESVSSSNSASQLTSVKKKRKVQHRTSQPCCFCGAMETNLSRHITTVHRKETEVTEVLKQPAVVRNAKLSEFRKRGMMKYNENIMKRKEADCLKLYQRQRISKCGDDDLVICSACKGCYSATFFYRHRKLCSTISSIVPQKAPVGLMSSVHSDIPEEFTMEVLARFYKDDVGEFCRNDPVLVKFGAKLYEKTKQNPEKCGGVKKSTMQNMRRLGYLFFEFQNQCRALAEQTEKPSSIVDMLSRRRFESLQKAIKAYTLADTDEMKAGLKHHVFYLVLKFAKHQKVVYLIEENDVKAKEVENFIDVLNLNSKDLLGDSLYKLHKSRQTLLRKPQEILHEDDVAKVKEYTVKRVRTIMNDHYSLCRSSTLRRVTGPGGESTDVV